MQPLRRQPYLPVGYKPPIRVGSRLVTQTGIVIGGALERRAASNDTPYNLPTPVAAPSSCSDKAVAGLCVLCAGLLAVGHITQGVSLWSSWAEYRAALAGATDFETALLAVGAVAAVVPAVLAVGLFINSRTKEAQ